ncbi:dihydroflavonol-4-reductase, partial [Penicillium canescens]
MDTQQHEPKCGDFANKIILITGASGYVATYIVDTFLKRGYSVRGTVRSDQTAERVRKVHKNHENRLSLIIVEDIAVPGAFDNAVKGVDGIIHTASPFKMTVQDNERELFLPAINSTISILQAAMVYAPNVRRIVITSSFAAILNMRKGLRPGYTYTEADWNPETYKAAKTADGGTAYCASKALAEKAAVEFVANRCPPFSVASICPPMIYGPVMHKIEQLTELNTSAADIYRLMNGTMKEVPATAFYAFADVRDVAEAHLRAFETSVAGGQRFSITSGKYTYQQVVDILQKNVPEVRSRTPVGHRGDSLPEVYNVSNEKAKTELGMTFRTLEDTITDMAR